MSTTVTNTNPISITGGTMASGARATIYPNQIARSFKVTGVGIIAGNNASTFSISDNSTGANLLFNGKATVGGLNYWPFAVPVTWADWKVSALLNTSDTILVWIK